MILLMMVKSGCQPLEPLHIDEPENVIVRDIDGNVYHPIRIGTQIWMIENLKATKFNDGTRISHVKNNQEWLRHNRLRAPAYAEYDNTPSNAHSYGRLYNWHVLGNVKNICPSGWHVPSDVEWEILINYLGGVSEAGRKLKEAGITHWKSPNTGGNNISGFTALPSGKRQASDGKFSGFGEEGLWWSKTEITNELASAFQLYYDYSGMGVLGWNKGAGFCIRCIKD
ncbi:fibrobacter succinogenes major paralogous domain-containing protein [Negadavirga shengliensis]|uniref:Fibrobacter succinogenes major paralogous domain-containing protein n=1 Tax=Negadavirga shengliensis TaxID=1389218 RepID=A0ABV9T069_9BACT